MIKMKRQHIKLKNTPQVKKYNQALRRASTDKMKKIIGVLLVLPLALLFIWGIVMAVIETGTMFELIIALAIFSMAIVGATILSE